MGPCPNWQKTLQKCLKSMSLSKTLQAIVNPQMAVLTFLGKLQVSLQKWKLEMYKICRSGKIAEIA